MAFFNYIKNQTIKQNLNINLQHILELSTLAKDKNTNYSDTAISSIRQSIIIHTSSVIEGLLFDYMELFLDELDYIEYKWELTNKKIIYEIDDDNKIIAGKYVRKKLILSKNKLNISQIINLLKSKNLLTDKLFKSIDEVRKLRNGQHLGTKVSIQDYKKQDLEFSLKTLGLLNEFLYSNYTNNTTSP